jgi:hypothetical protein
VEIGLQKALVKLMPVELQDDRHELVVEEGEVVRHEVAYGVVGFNWQASVAARARLVRAILFFKKSCTLLHDLEVLV